MKLSVCLYLVLILKFIVCIMLGLSVEVGDYRSAWVLLQVFCFLSDMGCHGCVWFLVLQVSGVFGAGAVLRLGSMWKVFLDPRAVLPGVFGPLYRIAVWDV